MRLDSIRRGRENAEWAPEGSNAAHGAFNELVGGVSGGNLAGGKGGVLLGFNSIAGASGTQNDREIRPFMGLEYTF